MMASDIRSAVCLDISNVDWKKFNGNVHTQKNVVSIFLSDIDSFSDSQFSYFRKILSADEIIRADAFIPEINRKQYILAHYLLRILVAQFLNIPPDTISFSMTSGMKPFIESLNEKLAFNISHAGNKVMIGFNFSGEIGVDIEKLDSLFDYKNFSIAHFSENEQKMLETENDHDSICVFFNIWTKKESWLKLTGEGIIDDLKSIDVSGSDNEKVFIYSFLEKDYAMSVALNGPYPLECWIIDSF